MSRQPQVKLTSTFDLSCIVSAGYSDLKVPLTVTWQFRPARSSAFDLLVRITHNGTIEWGDFLPQFQKKTKVSQSLFRSQLLVHDATEEEAGVYQCKAEVYDRRFLYTNSPVRASATSHPLRIAITLPGKYHLKLILLKKKKKGKQKTHIPPIGGKLQNESIKIPFPHVCTEDVNPIYK